MRLPAFKRQTDKAFRKAEGSDLGMLTHDAMMREGLHTVEGEQRQLVVDSDTIIPIYQGAVPDSFSGRWFDVTKKDEFHAWAIVAQMARSSDAKSVIVGYSGEQDNGTYRLQGLLTPVDPKPSVF